MLEISHELSAGSQTELPSQSSDCRSN